LNLENLTNQFSMRTHNLSELYYHRTVEHSSIDKENVIHVNLLRVNNECLVLHDTG
jgi:hypothetical protein